MSLRLLRRACYWPTQISGSVKVNATIRTILMSEIMLLLPFVLWGALALWEHRRSQAVGDADANLKQELLTTIPARMQDS